jgi:hypothetical protein
MTDEWDNIDNADWGVPTESVTDKKEKPTEQPTTATNSKRRSTELIEVSEKFLMRRAYGEDILLQRMGIEPLKPGHSYHCITGGDVDALSFLKVVMLHARNSNTYYAPPGACLQKTSSNCKNGTIAGE